MEVIWIRIEDALPELNKPVLVYSPADKDVWTDSCIFIDFLFKDGLGNVHWDWCADPDKSTGTMKNNVTHWAPLPSTPKTKPND